MAFASGTGNVGCMGLHMVRGCRVPARMGSGRCAIACMAIIGSVVVAVPVAAQVDGATTTVPSGPATTTTTTSTLTTSTSVPESPLTTTSSPDTTAPSAPDEATLPSTTLPAPLVTDQFSGTGEGAGDSPDPSSSYSKQGAFDPASKAVLTAQLLAAQRDLATTRAQLALAQAAVDRLDAEQGDLSARIALSDAGSQRSIADVANARDLLRRRAVAAFVGSDPVVSTLFGVSERPADYAVAYSYMQRLAETQRGALLTLDTARRALGAQDRALADDQATLSGRLAAAHDLAEQISRVADIQQLAVDALSAGSHVTVAGFVFPVVGEVNFSDSWGAPRLAGTSRAHWHEGCDIMAPLGRELVAAEDGVLTKVGSNGLGGTSLSITGVSGTRYYYAHLSAYAPGIVQGGQVTAGQAVGYAGNTGDAAGGPTHLHFEIHPDGGPAVDPYPLLRAAYDTRRRAQLTAVVRSGSRNGSGATE